MAWVVWGRCVIFTFRVRAFASGPWGFALRGCFSFVPVRFAFAFALTLASVCGVVAVYPLVGGVFALLVSFSEPFDHFVDAANAFSVVCFEGSSFEFVIAGFW